MEEKARLRILVLEPARLYQQILSQFLDIDEVEVLYVRTADEGLKLLAQREFDLICASLHLKGELDGIEFSQRVRQGGYSGTVPILMLASEMDPTTLARAYRAGVTDVLMKSEIALFSERLPALLPKLPTGLTGGGRILVLYEDGDQLELLRARLESASFETVGSLNALQARSALVKGRIDLFICEADGLERERILDLIQQMAQHPQWRSIPVLAMSQNEDPQERFEILESGVQDLQSKQVSDDELLLRIRNLLRLRRLHRQLELERERLRELSTTDPLTGLYNRVFLIEACSRRFPEARRHHANLTLMVISVDRFKTVNEVVGREKADEVLREVALLVRNFFRQEDLPARFGTAVFAVILQHCNEDSGVAKAEQLREVVRTLRPSGLSLTVSIGLASTPRGESPGFDELLKRADEALFEAQRAKGDQVRVA